MMVYVVERIAWKERGDWSDYEQSSHIIGASMSLDSAKDMVLLDSCYYSYDFKWSVETSYVGYVKSLEGNHGVRYEVRLVPYK